MTHKIRAGFAAVRADAALVERTAAACQAGKARRRRIKPLPLLAAAALITLCLFGGGLYFTADAYVSIDVNPSIELTLNRFDRVIAAAAFNEEGAALLARVDPRGKSYGDAADALLRELASEGYLSTGAQVTVTVQTTPGRREQSLCAGLERRLDAGLKQGHHAANLTVFPVTAEVRREAHSCHMSPAQYIESRGGHHGRGHHGGR